MSTNRLGLRCDTGSKNREYVLVSALTVEVDFGVRSSTYVFRFAGRIGHWPHSR